MPSVLGIPTVGCGKLLEVLRTAGPIITYILDEKNQGGGILCVAGPKTGLTILLSIFGCLNATDHGEYMLFAQEKAVRLARNITDFSSFQTRNLKTEPKKYGGAVRGRNFIFSFSGFTEEQDEAAMLALAVKLEEIDLEQARRIAEISGNQYFSRLWGWTQ